MRKLTHEEFMERFYEKNETAENIEILGEYVGSKIKIKCKCKVDGYEFEMRPNNLLNNQGCPKCAGRHTTTEEFKQEMKKINDNIEILGEYIGTDKKIKCKCKIDGYEWETTPHNLLNNHGCPKCAGRNKTTEEFVDKMKEINNDIEILGEYKTSYTKIKCRCKLDGYEWEAKPRNLLSNRGCPKCNASKGEKRVAEYLDDRNIEYKQQYKFDDCRSKYKLPFDFYILSKNIAIEYDGRQHYEIIDYFDGLDGFIDTKIRDTIKTIYCKENNIKLIRIAYWDFDKIEEILYLFDIFKQLSDLEEDYRNYEWQQSLIKKKYLGTLYTHDSEYIMLSDKKVKVRSDIGIILKHLEEEFDIDIDFEFSAIDYTFSKIEIGFQKSH